MTIKKLLHQIFLKRKGGKTSAKIVDLLLIRPYNGSQIARIIEMDYNTIEYHLEILCKSKLVMCESDSYGSLYPEQVRRLADKYIKIAEKYGKSVGIHAHNNQQLAFANTIEACSIGVSLLDATVSGMGRGAGNCYSELLLGFLRNPKFNIVPVLKFIEKHMVPLKASGVVWGCDVQYMLTGQTNQHPRTAIAFTKAERTDYAKYYTEITGDE